MPAPLRAALACLALLLAGATYLPPPTTADAGGAASFSATKTAALAGDLDGDREAEPGDVLRYTLVLRNTGAADIAGLALADTLDPNTVLDPATLTTTPLALDVQVALAATAPVTATGQVTATAPITIALQGREWDGDPLTYSVVTSPTLGQVSGPVGSTVTYTPDGSLAAEDSFAYRVTDDDGNHDTATVRIAPAAGGSAPQQPGAAAAPSTRRALNPPRPTPAPDPPTAVELDIGLLPAGKSVTVRFDAAISDALPANVTQISNQAVLSSASFAGVLSDDPTRAGAANATVTPLIRRRYFPLVTNLDTGLPDLAVERLEVTRTSVRVVVRNRSAVSVTRPFRVEVYLAPRRAPSAANDLWGDLCEQGLVWQITGPTLPLEPGAALVLEPGDARFDSARSLFSGTIPSGAAVYAQADVLESIGAYGAVLEGDEVFEQSYNNIAGPVPAP